MGMTSWARNRRARKDWHDFWDTLVTDPPQPTMTVARFYEWWARNHWHLIDVSERVEVAPGDVVTIIYEGDGLKYQVLIVEGDDDAVVSTTIETAARCAARWA